MIAEFLEDRNRAFDVFRKSYRKSQVIEEQKATLHEKYRQAKQHKDLVNEARKNIGEDYNISADREREK